MNTRNLSTEEPQCQRRAFTLVEVLVVLVLVSILAGMVMTAVRGVTNSARLSRTQFIIGIIDSVLQEQYESYKYRPLPVTVPNLSTLPNPDLELVFTYEMLPSEAARVRLNMIRDLQRMELPERISDIMVVSGNPPVKRMNFPAEITAVVSPVVRDDSTTPARIRRDNRPESRVTARVEWFGNNSSGVNSNNASNVPSRFASYFRRALPTWTEQHQGAECLYLILASSFVGGAPAIEMIPDSNIGDTDGDGMLEILDGWGQPIAFIRWPSGYESPLLTPEQVLAERLVEDDFDLFRADFGFHVDELIPEDIPDIPFPWSMRPLVISAGSDGEFGIHFAPGTGFRYNSASPSALTPMTWPTNYNNMGPEWQGRTGAYYFVDPYYRQVSVTARPGALITGFESVRADNVTNYQLAAE